MSALPAATSLGGSLGSAGAISSTSRPWLREKPFSRAMISGRVVRVDEPVEQHGELVGGLAPAGRPSSATARTSSSAPG